SCRPLDGEFYRARSARWENITVPLLTAANWGGQGLHTRGNFEGFVRAASPRKWLEVHGLEHWTHFYTDYGQDLQKRFFACFLKGDEGGWRDQPRFSDRSVPSTVSSLVQNGNGRWPAPAGPGSICGRARASWARTSRAAKAASSTGPTARGSRSPRRRWRQRPRSPGRCPRGFSCPRPRPTPTCSACCGCSRRTAPT